MGRLRRAYGRLTAPDKLPVLIHIGLRNLADLSLVLFALIPHLLPLFDSSPSIDRSQWRPGHILRWDAFHYLSIAQKGYEWEQQAAFMPGWPGAIRLGGRVVASLGRLAGGATGEVKLLDLAGAGLTLASIARVFAIQELYKMTHDLYGGSFAMTSTMLYLLVPCPAVLSSVYTESPFACLAFAGYRRALTQEWLSASLFLAAATGVRATGVFNAVVVGLMVLQSADGRLDISRAAGRLPQAVISASIVVLPFFAFQAYTYWAFCSGTAQPEWCSLRLPFSYSFVQSKYWNNGLFKYWEPAQIGNWLLAAPMLAISLFASYAYLQPPIPSQRLLPSNDKRLRGIQLHHLITTLLLVFVGNVQISLRVSVTNPVVWWTAAELAFDWSGGAGKMTRIGRWWVAWCVIWGAVSLILWAGFYPPA